MDNPLRQTLTAAISLLDQHSIPYALVGGLAASLRGQPRATADVELVIGVDIGKALSLLSDLETTAFEPLFEGVAEVVERAFILPLKHRETGVKVDLALGLSGFEQQLLSRTQEVNLLGESVQVASAEDLIVMKLLAGRPRDQQDAEGIVMVQGDSIDWDYCRETALRLGQAVEQDLVGPLDKLKKAGTEN